MPISLNQIVQKQKEIMSAHRQVRTVRYDNPASYTVNEIKDVTYPAVFFFHNNTAIEGKQKTYSFIYTIADIYHQDGITTELEVHSDTERMADDILSQLDWQLQPWQLRRAATLEYFRDDFGDVLAGVTFQVDLIVDYSYDACDLPSTYELPSSSFVYINTARFMTLLDIIIPTTETTYEFTNDLLQFPPFVFLDGLLLTYVPQTDRRYAVHDQVNRTVEIIGGVREDENLRIII
jgi:hypothetical protein